MAIPFPGAVCPATVTTLLLRLPAMSAGRCIDHIRSTFSRPAPLDDEMVRRTFVADRKRIDGENRKANQRKRTGT
jgi:hypothetical protein